MVDRPAGTPSSFETFDHRAGCNREPPPCAVRALAGARGAALSATGHTRSWAQGSVPRVAADEVPAPFEQDDVGPAPVRATQDATDALEKGMAEKRTEFRDKGTQVDHRE